MHLVFNDIMLAIAKLTQHYGWASHLAWAAAELADGALLWVMQRALERAFQ